jgi:hypothetical protein
MKDANQTILYTKETREVLQPTLHLQSTQSSRAAEQQSSRAAEHSADHVTLRSAAWQLVVASVVASSIFCLRHLYRWL